MFAPPLKTGRPVHECVLASLSRIPDEARLAEGGWRRGVVEDRSMGGLNQGGVGRIDLWHFGRIKIHAPSLVSLTQAARICASDSV